MSFVDANVFMYAAGRPSPQREPCRAFLRSVVAAAAPPCCTSTEVLQEILRRYRAIGRAQTAFTVFDSVVQLGIPIMSVGMDELRLARRLLETCPGLSTRDGVHLGTMEAHGIRRVLSYDRGFEEVDWVERLEPSLP